MLSINQTYTGVHGDASFNDDTVVMAMSAGTHIDALGHVHLRRLHVQRLPRLGGDGQRRA